MSEEERLKKDVDSLKRSMNDWVLFLDGNQRDTKLYIRELERRIRDLETRQKIY